MPCAAVRSLRDWPRQRLLLINSGDVEAAPTSAPPLVPLRFSQSVARNQPIHHQGPTERPVARGRPPLTPSLLYSQCCVSDFPLPTCSCSSLPHRSVSIQRICRRLTHDPTAMSAISPARSTFDDQLSPDGTPRRERAAIAAQACETCRSRKSKCDERRPRCGLCQRLGTECKYREPLPTKKDKTLLFMLDALSRIEGKVDQIGKVVSPVGVDAVSPPFSGHLPSVSSVQPRKGNEHQPSRRQSLAVPHTPGQHDTSVAYVHVTASHKVLLWPFIRSYLKESHVDVDEDLESLSQEGTPWFLRQEMRKHPKTLPYDVRLTAAPVHDVPSPDGTLRTKFAELTLERMTIYAQQYFSSFNMVYLLLDKSDFMDMVLPKVARYGFGDGDADSIIALVVFSLGKLALEGSLEPPVISRTPWENGLPDASTERPPGLEIFNEARRRIGFFVCETSLENIQILLLSAIYYEACGRHLDFWRASQSASTAFQVLIKCLPVEWSSKRGNLLKRVYWTCNLIESWYHFELDLPQTGICDHEDDVPLPGEILGPSAVEDQSTVMHFLAIIALRRLVTRVHKTIFEATNSTAESPEGYGGPPTHVIDELARQLDSWRSMLPPDLQWADEPPEARFQYVQRSVATDGQSSAVFMEHGLGMLNAQLRSRYYYTRFMIYRPFVFKALHFPELMTDKDSRLVGLCIKSALMWPIALPPSKLRKRLVPHMYAWTQNFLGILLILRMTTISPVLDDVCRNFIDQRELVLTVQHQLEWFADVRDLDGIADWSWKILEPLFRGMLPIIDGFSKDGET
ncbi:uncharacterized protein K452DRAFT_285324 [Aplosporella prunicola CBS 121167]|uniref:Zn(2)-C6 fungal-type domain-containing protein n=1 Tax=Aplosporella prunicola CBS 121167 TaxID=1176127 RepID=A0A6A6BNH2_9PEZI|nr:uncharacterized protein K452DRAFT_285324 [Aplosporella prunicola CBS 121167]KAF2144101.1 hypothetical protein K452DRAFT_285324 [Aplosporella prunicola CBS 121167]